MTNTENNSKPDLLKQMSSVVSHELRNPLAIMSNSIYFIKAKLGAGGAAVDPKVTKHLGVIEGEIKHSNEVIDAMLAFTRKPELQLSPLSLNAVVSEQASAWQAPAGITLKVTDDAAGPRVSVDKDKFCYAMRCVLSNAALAMPEGGEIKAAVSGDGKTASVTFTDRGPGLPGGDGEKVFEPFYTTRPRGIGLGLPIARKFLEAMGGSAKAQNAVGGGAQVTLSLPQL